MTRITVLFALVAVFLVPGLALAEASEMQRAAGDGESAIETGDVEWDALASDASGVPAEVDWDRFDDPNFDPALIGDEASVETARVNEPSDTEILGSVVSEEAAQPRIQLEQTAGIPVRSEGVILGPLGYDDLGRAGRLHTVSSGDTLWDLSAAYLGTPWVWPSVWIDNDDIDNPHLILPGNKIWITANEMRVVTDAEAEAFLGSVVDNTGSSEGDGSNQAPSLAMDDSMMNGESVSPVAAFDDSSDSVEGTNEPSTLEAFPIAVSGVSVETAMRGQRVTVSRREQIGFVSAEKFAGASTIVGSPIERIYISSGDDVILGMGEGDVEIGDRFSVFNVIEEVRDSETLRLLGHHVDSLGWVEVKELTGDTSIAEVRTSYSEIDRGAWVVRRESSPPTSVEVRTTPDVIEGKVVFLPSERALMADGGYVYLNRGEFHGVEIGSDLEVFDSGAIVEEPARRVGVRTPDHVVARLVVISVEPDSSVGFVLWSKRELAVGDTIRAAVPTLAQR